MILAWCANDELMKPRGHLVSSSRVILHAFSLGRQLDVIWVANTVR